MHITIYPSLSHMIKIISLMHCKSIRIAQRHESAKRHYPPGNHHAIHLTKAELNSVSITNCKGSETTCEFKIMNVGPSW